MPIDRTKLQLLLQAWDRVQHEVPPRFPLKVHRSAGRFYATFKPTSKKPIYFGMLPDWRAALDQYNREFREWEAGRNPRIHQEAAEDGEEGNPTIYELGMLFLNAKNAQRKMKRRGSTRNRLANRSYMCIKRAILRCIYHFGKNRRSLDISPEEWEKFHSDIENGEKVMQPKKGVPVEVVYRPNGPCGMHFYVSPIRSMCKWAVDPNRGILSRPLRFADCFPDATKEEKKLEAAKKVKERGEKIHEKDTIWAILAACSPQQKAQFLLSINTGMGCADCGLLNWSDVNLEEGYINLPRTRTEEPRPYMPLWPETIDALLAIQRLRLNDRFPLCGDAV